MNKPTMNKNIKTAVFIRNKIINENLTKKIINWDIINRNIIKHLSYWFIIEKTTNGYIFTYKKKGTK